MRVVMSNKTPPPTPSTSSIPSQTSQQIKKETQDDEIKEYAETAMNELLGWYGYDKVDRSATQGLNLHHFAAQRSPSDLDSSEDSSSPGPGHLESSSRESPTLGDGDVDKTCSWCAKLVDDKQLFSVKTPGGEKAFCSEICFSQCRRANFKRNKTCDWCRHIRHTVNYVDFQDGEYQLQFCSDKCLNQYKMNIFCRETQAHLQMHPHLQGDGPGVGVNNLITPELWLRDCRSGSPSSDRSVTPPPPQPPSPARTPSPEPAPTRLRRTTRRRTATITSPTDLRTNSLSPGAVDKPLPRLHMMPPILHPTPRLFHPEPPRPPFMPHLLPPPHMFVDHPRCPMLRPPVRPTPPPPPPRHRPPYQPLRSLLPPVTVMVPYPIVIPFPIPIPIPIPIFWPRDKVPEFRQEVATSEHNADKHTAGHNADKHGEPATAPINNADKHVEPATTDKQEEVATASINNADKHGEGTTAPINTADKHGEGAVAAFLRLTSPRPPPPPHPPPPTTPSVEETTGPRQPLRKRKRLNDGKSEEEAEVRKRKYVPV